MRYIVLNNQSLLDQCLHTNRYLLTSRPYPFTRVNQFSVQLGFAFSIVSCKKRSTITKIKIVRGFYRAPMRSLSIAASYGSQEGWAYPTESSTTAADAGS
jgi:hypothetical protein